MVCLLGGESTGKTSLAQALHSCLSATHGLSVAWVPEHLREWCTIAGRPPLASEQTAIANEQDRRVSEARDAPGVQLVVTDTSALTIAAYSELYFNDRHLWPSALQAQQRFSATLLMGLDLPWVADGLFRDSEDMRNRTDALLRQMLQSHNIAHQTVYGQGPRRLHNALRALTPVLQPLLGAAPVETDAQRTAGRPGWQCEACSDPDCEHRMFTRLVNTKPTRQTP